MLYYYIQFNTWNLYCASVIFGFASWITTRPITTHDIKVLIVSQHCNGHIYWAYHAYCMKFDNFDMYPSLDPPPRQLHHQRKYCFLSCTLHSPRWLLNRFSVKIWKLRTPSFFENPNLAGHGLKNHLQFWHVGISSDLTNWKRSNLCHQLRDRMIKESCISTIQWLIRTDSSFSLCTHCYS
jgi:hypothetical protein